MVQNIPVPRQQTPIRVVYRSERLFPSSPTFDIFPESRFCNKQRTATFFTIILLARR